MSFSGRTPESFLERSDSKNPSTTCKGLTTSGRPCRRALGSLPKAADSYFASDDDGGIVAVLDQGDAAAFFCWQHKDQAESLLTTIEAQRRTKLFPLKGKNSIDTLIERVGVLNLDEDNQQQQRMARHDRKNRDPRNRRYAGSRAHDRLPQEWQAIQGPLMSVPEDTSGRKPGRLHLDRNRDRDRDEERKARRQSRPPQRSSRSNVKASWACCIQADEDDDPPTRRRRADSEPRRPKPHHSPGSRLSPNVASGRSTSVSTSRRTEMQQPRLNSATNTSQLPLRPSSSPRPTSFGPAHSQTTNFLSLIPAHLSPTITSALLAELSKAVSSADEAGYIYVFWLTPESEASKPDDETASSLIDDDLYQDFDLPEKRTGEALRRYASVKQQDFRSSSSQRKILLKIGRATNVHRRLSQWTKQCGQNITLIRYYPYRRDHASSASSPAGSMVPHVHKVERLVHLELADMRVTNRGACGQCGREHKEWFEVDATRRAVKSVDATIRRWVDWAEQNQ